MGGLSYEHKHYEPLMPLDRLAALTPLERVDYLSGICEGDEFLESDPVIRGLVEALATDAEYASNQTLTEAYSAIKGKLQAMQPELEDNAFAPGPKTSQVNKGDITLGHLLRMTDSGFTTTRHAFKIFSDWLFTGLLLEGKSGSGKTRLLGALLCQLLFAFQANFGKTGCMYFEFWKREGKLLYTQFRRLGLPVHILSHRNLAINLLEPGLGTPPKVHAATIAAILSEAFELNLPGMQALRDAILSLYFRYGCLSHDAKVWPNLLNLYDEIPAVESHPATQRSIRAKLKEFIHHMGPETLAYSNGIAPHTIEEHCSVFELAGLPFSQIIALYYSFGLYNRRVELGAGHPIALVIEEGRYIAMPKTGRDQLPLFHRLTEVSRAMRLAWVLSNQTSDISEDLVNAAGLQIIGQLKSRHLVKALQQVGLGPGHYKWAAQQQRKRQWIVSANDLEDFKGAAVIESIPFEYGEIPDFSKIEDTALKEIKIVRSEDAMRVNVTARTEEHASAFPSGPNATNAVAPTEEERRYLHMAALNPDFSMSQLHGALVINPGKGSHIADELERKEFIKTEKILTGHRQWYKIACVEENARRFLSPQALTVLKSLEARSGKSGKRHGHKARRLVAFCQCKGWKTTIEQSIHHDGQTSFIDLVTTDSQGQQIGIEVEESGDGLVSAHKAMFAKLSRLYLIVRDNKHALVVAEKIKNVAASCPIKIATLKDFGLEALPVFDQTGKLLG